MTERVKVGCLWINDKGKSTHTNIIINEKRYVAFVNDFKKTDSDPDMLIYLNTPKPEK